MSDLSRSEALERAQEVLDSGWTVFFKFTCEKCQERVVLQEPNTLYEYGECCICGHSTKLDKVGFMLMMGTQQNIALRMY